jgi:hypothetical protein
MTLIEVSISDHILLLDVDLGGEADLLGPESSSSSPSPSSPHGAAPAADGRPRTVAELAARALLEFQTAFSEEPPSKVRFVRDAQGRILSGALLLRSVNFSEGVGRLTVDLVDASAGGNRGALSDDICEQYMHWQLHTARRARDSLLRIADAGAAEPSADFLALLRDLRAARWEEVQIIVVEALSAILDFFRQPTLVRFATQELQSLLRDSEHAAVTVASFRKIAHSRTAYRHIEKPLLVKTMTKALNLMKQSQIEQECLDLFDYLEEAAAPPGAPGEAIDISNNFDEKSMPNDQYVGQLLKWLVSDAAKQRHFALQKVVRLVWAHADQHGERTFALTDFQWFQIVEHALLCLKLSLRPSSVKLGTVRAPQRRGSSSLPAVRAVESVRAMQVARAALTSEDSDVVSAQLILHTLSMIGCMHPSIIRNVLLNIDVAFCKLLTTLCHSEELAGVGYAKSSWHFELAELTKRKCLFSIRGYSKNPISVGDMSISDCCSFLLLLAMKKSDAPPPWEQLGSQYDQSDSSFRSALAEPRSQSGAPSMRSDPEEFDISRSAPWSSRIAVETKALLLFLGAPAYCPRVLFAMVYILHQVTIRVDMHIDMNGGPVMKSAESMAHNSRAEGVLDPAVVKWLSDPPDSSRAASPDPASAQEDAAALKSDASSYLKTSSEDATLLRCIRRWAFAGRRLPGAIALQILALVSSAAEVQLFLMDRRVLPKVIASFAT